MDAATTPPPDGVAALGADPGSGAVPRLSTAPIEDQERCAQASRALRETGDIAAWGLRFALLGDVNRLRILLAVHRAPGITVGDLAAVVEMTDNAASQALSALRIAGVVTAVRDGRFRRWSIADPKVHDILHAVGASHTPGASDH